MRYGQNLSRGIAHLTDRLERLDLLDVSSELVTGNFPALRILHLGGDHDIEVDHFEAPLLEELKWSPHLESKHSKLAEALGRHGFLPRLKKLEVYNGMEKRYYQKVKRLRPKLKFN